MRIFLSWSGEISKRIADEIKVYIPIIFDDKVVFFYSPEIRKGEKWQEELFKNIANCKATIICITPENKGAPWINFEAGVIAANEFKTCPIYFGFRDCSTEGPLSCFQATLYNKTDFFRLIESINNELDEKIDKEILKNLFEKNWKHLNSGINSILRENNLPTTGRDRIGVIKHAIKSNVVPSLMILIVIIVGLPLIFTSISECIKESNRFNEKWGQNYGILTQFEISSAYSKYISEESKNILEKIENNKIKESSDPNISTIMRPVINYDNEMDKIKIPCSEINLSFTYDVNDQSYSASELGKEEISYSIFQEMQKKIDMAITVYYNKQSPREAYIYNPEKYVPLRSAVIAFLTFILVAYFFLRSISRFKTKSNSYILDF